MIVKTILPKTHIILFIFMNITQKLSELKGFYLLQIEEHFIHYDKIESTKVETF